MRKITNIGLALAMAMMLGVTASAQDDENKIELSGDAPTSLNRLPSTQELRQLRALRRQQERIARLEANAWAGYDPLRPTRAAIPYTQSHYKIYVPHGYIWPAWAFMYAH